MSLTITVQKSSKILSVRDSYISTVNSRNYPTHKCLLCNTTHVLLFLDSHFKSLNTKILHTQFYQVTLYRLCLSDITPLYSYINSLATTYYPQLLPSSNYLLTHPFDTVYLCPHCISHYFFLSKQQNLSFKSYNISNKYPFL